jgi:hypothetical protein
MKEAELHSLSGLNLRVTGRADRVIRPYYIVTSISLLLDKDV